MVRPAEGLSNAESQALHEIYEQALANGDFKPSTPTKKMEKKPADSTVYTGAAKPATPNCDGKCGVALFAETAPAAKVPESKEKFPMGASIKARDPNKSYGTYIYGTVISFEKSLGQYRVSSGNGEWFLPESWVSRDEFRVEEVQRKIDNAPIYEKVYQLLKPF